MFKKTDPYTYSKFAPLHMSGKRIGTLRADYQVTSYENVKLQDVTSIAAKTTSRQYLVECTQSISLFNEQGLDLSPSTILDRYTNYPLLINISIEPTLTPGVHFQLLQYSPETVNTKVQASGSHGWSNGTTAGVSSSNTIGSSTAQTNSYGTSVSLGESPSVSANYENSTTTTSDHSSTVGSESSKTFGTDSSSSASMSVKDWGAYALVNAGKKSVVWTFGQEYPWDAIECRSTNGSLYSMQTEIVIPTAMAAQLYDGVSLYPPSHLSSFGIHFLMKAMWLVSIENAAAELLLDPHNDSICFSHWVNYFSGSHALDSANVVHVYMDKCPTTLGAPKDSPLTTRLDLGLMALDAVGKGRGSGIVGFIPRKFAVQPTPFTETVQATPFQIFSNGNNLLIKDTTGTPAPVPTSGGFSSGETTLSAQLVAGLPALAMTLYFKVLDADSNYVLYLKHWIVSGDGVEIKFIINGDEDNAIKKFVVALEAEGGDNNLTQINLRNLDYSTVDYTDYLQLGLNSIEMRIEPIKKGSDCEYRIRAVSIEQE